jgi:IclR family transcriptional regulator, acetate operon repressor
VLQKLSDVLALFTPDRPELSVREIAKPFRWPKSTAYRILARVEEAGFLDRDERSGLYRLGIRLATLGELARHSTSLQRIASAALHRLSAETAETATLMLLHGAEGVTVDVVESYQPLMLPGLLGARQPLHATAGGKVFLAWAPPGRQRALIRPPLKRYTSTTTTDVDTLMRELDMSRRRGYTTVNGENVEDVVGVAAPIHDHHGDVSAALTVGGPRSRTATKLESLGLATIAAAASVSAALGYHGHKSHGSIAAPRRAAAAPAKPSRATTRPGSGTSSRAKRGGRKRTAMAGR